MYDLYYLYLEGQSLMLYERVGLNNIYFTTIKTYKQRTHIDTVHGKVYIRNITMC